MTSNIVVIYRAYVDGAWLPWVSNADPEWMQSVQSKYNLGGTLDTNGSYAGKSGKNISGVEIYVFEEGSLGNFVGGEVSASLSYMVDSTSNWNSFDTSTIASHIDGIKIQTGSDKPYYLSYRTLNAGQTTYYPVVKSTENDYAGSAGKPIQQLNIQVFKNDGTKLTSGVIVMYRAYVDGEWLPWVSNADPEWMRNVTTKYSLDGALDTSGSFAGKTGENIGGIELHIFEEDSLNAGGDDFSGNELNLSLSYMADSNDDWNSFSKSVTAEHIDGIKIQTDANQSFYLRYQTWNYGCDSYYPEVTSTENDYAGSAGKPIQRLSIHAYQNDGTKLTSGVVIMYRALVEGNWLPWVSNADPEWMQSVQSQYNLGGSLDLSASYAGISGKNIAGIEIRAFGGNRDTTTDNLPGTEAAPALSYMVDSNWNSFDKSVMAAHIDGIKIQTSSSKSYYIRYQTWNAGQSSYYPEVVSTGTDYAGSAGKPIQLLSIHVYKNDSTKLTTGVVVMYRAYVDGRWLPWVSNADPAWMQSVKAKYNLDGTLDTSGYYAGITGKNISGIEIRVFEEKNTNPVPTTPTGNYKIIQAPFICQLPKYPTGCESVSTVMALNCAGVNISVDDFITTDLDKSGTPFDPNVTFGGDPRSKSGFGCYAPVIKKALDKVLVGRSYVANVLTNVSLETLCSQYIDNGIPVIMWATMYMNPPYIGSTWSYNGKTIQWIAPEHCLLLVGYDDGHYIFNDPLRQDKQTYYTKSSVEAAYKGLGSQAIVILNHGPAIFSQIQSVFDAAKKYTNNDISNSNELVCQFGRNTEYNKGLWNSTAGKIDLLFYSTAANAIGASEFAPFNEPVGGYAMDIPHLMATLNALLHDSAATDFDESDPELATIIHLVSIVDLDPLLNDLAGWAGDLITVVPDIQTRVKNGETYAQAAKFCVGELHDKSHFGYTDLITDLDAYAISLKIRGGDDVATSFSNYYSPANKNRRFTTFYQSRFNGSDMVLYQACSDYLLSITPIYSALRTMALKGQNLNPLAVVSADASRAAIDAFMNLIKFKMLGEAII